MEYTKKQQKNTLRMTVVTALITTFLGSAINLCVPTLEAEFHTGAVTIGWIVTAYMLTVSSLSVPMGKLADATGRKRILMIGIGLMGVVSLACCFATSIEMLLTLRVLQGVAGSMIFSTNNAMLISSYPPQERGRVLGLSTAAVYTGLSLGPVLGGILNYNLGWRSIFAVTAGASLLSFLLSLRAAPADRPQKKVKFDLPGNLLFISMVSLSLYGFSTFSDGIAGKIMLGAGIILFFFFIQAERMAEDPVIRLSMFTRDRVYTLSNFAAMLNYGATFAITYLVSIYLQVSMGYTSQTAGLILITMPVVQALFSPTMGKLSDQIPPWKLASTGMVLCVAGLVMFALLQEETPLWYVIIALVVEGLGFALFSSPNTNAIMARVEQKDLSVANSILATMRTYGHASSMAIVTLVTSSFLGSRALRDVTPPELLATLHVAFYIFIVLGVAAVFMSAARGKE
jgi:EmrB/QacA subfamily drug resistance transporter